MQKKIKTDQDLERERQRYINWLNSEDLSNQKEIINLEKELSDGVVLLKIIEIIQPGIVDWSRVNSPAVNKFKKLGNCNYVLKLCKELKLPITGIGGRDIVDPNNKSLLFGVIWLLMRESYIAKHGPKNDDEVHSWANQFLDTIEDEVENDYFEDLPYSIVLYRGDEGEVFMGDEDDIYDCPFMPLSFECMICGESNLDRKVEIDFRYFLNRSKKKLRNEDEEVDVNNDPDPGNDELFESQVEKFNLKKNILRVEESGKEVAELPVEKTLTFPTMNKENDQNMGNFEGDLKKTPLKENSKMEVQKSAHKSKMKSLLESQHTASKSHTESKNKLWLEAKYKSIVFAPDETEETVVYDGDSSQNSENFSKEKNPVMLPDEDQETPNHLVLVEKNDIDFQPDEMEHTEIEYINFVKENTKRTLFPLKEDDEEEFEKEDVFEGKVDHYEEDGEQEEDIYFMEKGNYTLLDLMTMETPDDYYKEVLAKCMEKNYFSRFRIGKKISLPFYLKFNHEFSDELKLVYLKINRYFTRKFAMENEKQYQKILKPKQVKFNYTAKLKAFDYKIKKLKSSLKVIEDDEERVLFFKKEAERILQEGKLNLRTRLLLKRIELCLTDSTLEFKTEPGKIFPQKKNSYLKSSRNLKIDEDMQALFYKKVLMMRLCGKNSIVDRYRREKLGVLFSKFVEKYNNPIREEVNEGMIKKFAEEYQKELFNLRC